MRVNSVYRRNLELFLDACRDFLRYDDLKVADLFNGSLRFWNKLFYLLDIDTGSKLFE